MRRHDPLGLPSNIRTPCFIGWYSARSEFARPRRAAPPACSPDPALQGGAAEDLSRRIHALRGREVKAVFEELKQSVSPDLIFTPNRKDAHQDHRLIGELTWNTFRDHLILEYEIPKYDGDLGQPNVFWQLDAEMYQKKVRYLMDAFQSQHVKSWFEETTFLSLMRLRGMECNAPSGYAEAFYCRKLVL